MHKLAGIPLLIALILLMSCGEDIEDDIPVPGLADTKIAFQVGEDYIKDIYVMNADGSSQVNLTNSPEVHEWGPAWSPDGKKIAFTIFDIAGVSLYHHDDIYVMNVDGTDQVNLTNSPEVNDYGPCWSPDGDRIVFVSDRDGNLEIYVMNVDGTDQVNLTNSPEMGEWKPCWSPDGTKIAFASDRDGDDEIYVMNVDGSSQVNLTNFPGSEDNDPSWSPDGTKIAFMLCCSDIYSMNADGTDPVNLSNLGNAGWPCWSPFLR